MVAGRFCHTARCYKPRVSSNWSSKFRRISFQNLGVPPPGLDMNGAGASGRVVAVRGVLDSMNQQEMQVLLHEVSQRLGGNQRMFVPERLGQAAPGPSVGL